MAHHNIIAPEIIATHRDKPVQADRGNLDDALNLVGGALSADQCRGDVDAHVGPRRQEGRPVVVWDANEKTPQRGERGASAANATALAVQCELAALRLLEPR